MDYRTIWKNLPESGRLPYEIIDFEEINSKIEDLQTQRLEIMNKIDADLREDWTEEELMEAGYLTKSRKDIKIVFPEEYDVEND
jgi:hypothetical protein